MAPSSSESNSESLKVIYMKENDPHKTEFFVFCNTADFNAWKKDRSIPLVNVLQSFDIFSSDTKSHTGQVHQASGQSLSNTFGTSDNSTIIYRILEEGRAESYDRKGRSMKENSATVTRNQSRPA